MHDCIEVNVISIEKISSFVALKKESSCIFGSTVIVCFRSQNPIYKIYFWIGFKCLFGRFQETRKIQVVTVEVGNEVAMCELEAAIPCNARSQIRLMLNDAYSGVVLVAFKDLLRVVVAAVVNDDQLPVHVLLTDDALDGLTETECPVECGHDH